MDGLFVESAVDVVADVLELDSDEIGLDDAVVDDLGADSLDVVDLSFSLGKTFKVQMPQKSVVLHATEVSGDESLFVQNERLTAVGAELLQHSAFKYGSDQVKEGVSLAEIYLSTTVNNWINVCFAIQQSGLSGDELIKKYVTEFYAQMKAAV